MQFRPRLIGIAAIALCLSNAVIAALPDIYPPATAAHAELEAGLKAAKATHRRVIVDFGGNWCGDCHVLDGYFHDVTNAPILEANYVLVHVNVDRRDQNLDLAERYEIPLNKGVPALAILDGDGRLLYSQRTGEFEAMRRMESASVTEFLNHWKAPNAGRVPPRNATKGS